jgi:hypothetical protein
MKKMKYLSRVLFLGVALFAISCFEDPGTDILLEGTFVEIQEAATSAGPVVSKSYSRLNDGIAKRDSIRINLVGRQRSTPVVVSFQIDAASTAVPNVHYRMITTGTDVTIAPNSSFAFIYFEVLADNINPGEVWNLKFNLTGVQQSDVKLSENFKTFTRSIRTLCPFNRANFLGVYNVTEPGYGTYEVNSTAPTGTPANAIVIDNFWDFGGVVRYEFTTTSTAVTLPTQDVVMGGTTYVVAQNGSATYDACTYGFVVPYTVRRKSDNALFDSNVHTFVKK